MGKDNHVIKKNRFKNVGSRRVQNVLESLDSLSKCANKNNYEYTDADISKMMKVIREQVRILEQSFSKNNQGKTQTFEF